MDAYDPDVVPGAFGLNNTGAICYFNSILQVLVGCSSFVRTVLANKEYLAHTNTGKAMFEFVSTFGSQETQLHSARVLGALTRDLARRRPRVRFGAGQESASEALDHILDMMEPPAIEESKTGGESKSTAVASPITNLFLHRFRCNLHCRKCKQVVTKNTDYNVNFNLFHIDMLKTQPATEEEFSKAIRVHISATEDYRCPKCPCPNCGSESKAGKCKDTKCATQIPGSTAIRVYNLTMVPEIIFCMFNLYVRYGGRRSTRYFPERITFPASDGGKMIFLLVGQVEHSGSLSGGHYWARGRRTNGKVYKLNDTGVGPSSFSPSASTYIIAYHYAGTESAEDLVTEFETMAKVS